MLAAATFVTCAGSGEAQQVWDALDRVFALLIVSCPCALGIATPIALGLSGARAAQAGILLRDGGALEKLVDIKKFYFDKTGTLTLGRLNLESFNILSATVSKDRMRTIVSALEDGVEHPIADALRNHPDLHVEGGPDSLQKEIIDGAGIQALSPGGEYWRIGSLAWLNSLGIEVEEAARAIQVRAGANAFSVAGLAKDSELIAYFVFSDTIRPEARCVIQALAARGVSSAIVSGDSREAVEITARELGIGCRSVHAEMSPEDKAALAAGAHAAFVGDGVNDALALSKASIGIGLRGGAEICLKVSDVFLLRPDLRLLVTLIDGARSAQQLIRRHLAVSLIYNLSAAALAVCGQIGPLAAALIMPASSISVILSSIWNAPFKEGSKWR
ncbi:MAG: hypothetical protein DCC75_08445 [Proteobacteria bacterium]|nr:MAG: hypothetical protein DCC75_08445 [Pseudomonadota bacterium]